YSEIDKTLLDNMPFVSFDRHFGNNSPCVSSDNYMGGYIAAQTLHEKGSSNLLCFWTGSDTDSEPYKRIQGFKDYCEEKKISYNIIEHLNFNQTDTDMMSASKGFKSMVKGELEKCFDGKTFKYDGIFASSDHLGYIIKEYLVKKKIKIPEDVQIIGFDGVPVRGVGKPIVSSIHQSASSIAREGMRVLFELIENGSAPSIVKIPVKFVDGGTTRN
ncbi:MAG: substrate-binding domain-containing protein, partial [Butyrivibrio sp.]|nr:substrate-binding domain-containing protein [Butyrivibrio sp.]